MRFHVVVPLLWLSLFLLSTVAVPDAASQQLRTFGEKGSDDESGGGDKGMSTTGRSDVRQGGASSERAAEAAVRLRMTARRRAKVARRDAETCGITSPARVSPGE